MDRAFSDPNCLNVVGYEDCGVLQVRARTSGYAAGSPQPPPHVSPVCLRFVSISHSFRFENVF